MIQEDEYYAFGLNIPRVVVGDGNKYLYNGKEEQEAVLTDEYDYGARFYDPLIGRWNVVDPLAEEFDHVTAYSYGMNNPMRFVDPDGMQSVDQIDPPVGRGTNLNEVKIVHRKSGGVLITLPTHALPTRNITYRPVLPNPFFAFFAMLFYPSNMNDPSSDRIYKWPEIVKNGDNVNSKKTVDEIKREGAAEKQTGNGTEIINKEGGMQQADKDFDDITVRGSVRPNPSVPGGRIGKTHDGKTANVRNKSSDGRPTLEIYNPNSKKIETKIRYR